MTRHRHRLWAGIAIAGALSGLTLATQIGCKRAGPQKARAPMARSQAPAIDALVRSVVVPQPPRAQLYYYELVGSPLAADQAAAIASRNGLTVSKYDALSGAALPPAVSFHDPSSKAVIVYVPSTGALTWAGDYSKAIGQAPSEDDAVRTALAWVKVNGLPEANDPSLGLRNTVAINRQEFTVNGPVSGVPTTLRTVTLARTIGGLSVTGPRSVQSVDVTSTGVTGATRTMEAISQTAVPVTLKPASGILLGRNAPSSAFPWLSEGGSRCV